METFVGSDVQLQRLTAKLALEQAVLAGTTLEDITLSYARFDPDTGAQVDDEVLAVDMAAITTAHNNVTEQAENMATKAAVLTALLAQLEAVIE